MKRNLTLAAVLTTLTIVAIACSQRADDQNTSAKSEPAVTPAAYQHPQSPVEMHGGMSFMSKAHHFEVVFLAQGIRVYVYDEGQKPASAKGVSGQVTIKPEGGNAGPSEMNYVSAKEMNVGGMPVTAGDYLYVQRDLSKAEPKSFEATFALSQLPGGTETAAEFTQSFNGLTNRPYMCPMHADVWGESDESECPLCGMQTTVMRPDQP